MVYKTGLLIILSAFLLNAQIMLNPKRSDILNPPSGGGGEGYWSLRGMATGGSTGSGIDTAAVSIAVTAGDLIVAYSTARYDAESIEDTEGNSWTILETFTTPGTHLDNVSWWAVANGTATTTITVTFDTTLYSEHYVNVSAFNPNGGTINLAASTKTSEAYTKVRETSALSATGNNVVAIAHSEDATVDTSFIAGVVPDSLQKGHNSGTQFWSIFTGGVTSKTAYIHTTSTGWNILALSLFELE